MGYAEGNTHGFTRQDLEEETLLFRLLDYGDFDTSEDLLDHLRNNGYKCAVLHLCPFVELEVYAYEFFEVRTILLDHEVNYTVY